MKLSALRPCDACGGVIAPHFYVVRTSVALIKPYEANQTLNLAQLFNGSLALAEALGPTNSVKVGGEEYPELWTELFLCTSCYLSGEHNLAVLAERRTTVLEREKYK